MIESFDEKLAKFGMMLPSDSEEEIGPIVDRIVCRFCYRSMARDRIDSFPNHHSRSKSIVYKSTGIEFVFATKQCHHRFHLKCAKEMISNDFVGQYIVCPVSKTRIKPGTQPNDGEMKIIKENFYSPGQPTCIAFGNPTPIIKINYKFKDETGNVECLEWEEFLPLTWKGIKIAKMLKVAFERKLLFSVEHSDTKKVVNNIGKFCSLCDLTSRNNKMEFAANNYPNCSQHLEGYEKYLRAFGITNEDL